MMEAWRHLPEHVSPYLFQVGAFQLRYYSLMYLLAFALTYLLVAYRIKTEDAYRGLTMEFVQDVMVFLILGLLIGGRLGYVVFYNPAYYLSHPLEIFLPFEFSEGIRFVGISGMSYHGGAIGVLLAGIFFCRRRGFDFWRLADLFAPAVPLGYTFGRLGNFFNGELYGRPTQVPWGMYFPLDPAGRLRHPSQLYEAAGEGLLLFFLLWLVRRRRPFDGYLLALYVIGYGLVRFLIEFFREPDAHLGFFPGGLTMGQILCLFMVAAGVALYRLRAGAAKKI
ncbi:MAG TPA: prolipoprotein diacylglyceryl transferase [Syntrophales bacterium]|nr:prolipoprotein diacylglyceryl transferase [Syntrophales bacterium]HOM06511.1 prolipoprotein diacylglyceryl transferase [Syntrophales bacterium]HON99896.1 prolipoprotein diacylglyceryl transferase [Syntrophales bacterium]HPC00623.1 prolipoprotein diacylglyceryl transferase [Syntrophales bacterium]HPQ06227.1 prolipoprotein diacylglyceryl transferase [Syntrophales bacterium]